MIPSLFKSHTDLDLTLGRHLKAVEASRLGAVLQWVDGMVIAIDDIVVKGVLEVAVSVHSMQPLHIGVVVAEQEFWVAVQVPMVVTQLGVLYQHTACLVGGECRAGGIIAPGPGVAEPELRQQVKRRILVASVVHR